MFVRSRARPQVRLLIAMVSCAASFWSTPTEAYVRSRDPKTYSQLFWADPRQALEVARPPDDLGVTTADLRAAVQAAIATWSYPKISCTGVSLRLNTESTDSQVAGRDRTNRIIMRVGAWCRDPKVLTKNCHDEAAVAVTTVFSRHNPGELNDGEIVEADIEVNAVGAFRWAVFPEGPLSGRDYANLYDLTSALTHETGHFIGLDHNCQSPGAAFLIDHDGIPRVDCFSPPPAVQMSIEDGTMYPFLNQADLSVRTLTADDARGACEIYPTSSVPVDEWVGAGGCAVSSTRVPASRTWLGGLVAIVFMAIAAGVCRTTRRRRRATTRLPS